MFGHTSHTAMVQIIAPLQEQLGTATGQLHLFVPQHVGSQMVWPRATFGLAKGRSEGRAKDATGASGGPSSQLWCNELSYAELMGRLSNVSNVRCVNVCAYRD